MGGGPDETMYSDLFDPDRPGAQGLSQKSRIAGNPAEDADGACRDGIGARAHRRGAEEDRHRVPRRPEADVSDFDLFRRRLVESRSDGNAKVKLITPLVRCGFDGEFRSHGLGQDRVAQFRVDADGTGRDLDGSGHRFTFHFNGADHACS